MPIRRAGEGPTVVWFHNEITSAPGAFADRLAGTYHVIAPVHPGFGATDRPRWIQSVRDVADYYLDLLDELPDEHVAFVGESMGAWIAAELALRVVDRLSSVTLITPVGLRVPGHPAADFWFERDRDGLLFADPSKAPAVPIEESIANEESAARYGWQPRLYDPTLAPRLHRLRTPTLLVWSDGDHLLPTAHADRWGGVLPHAGVSHITGAGHFPTVEQPEEAAVAVLGFLAETTSPVGGHR